MKRSFTVLAVSFFLAAATVSSQPRHATSIVFTGDILLDRGVRKAIQQRGIDQLFSPGVDSVFNTAQVVVGNLECPATKRQTPVFKHFIFRAEPEWLHALKLHGITHLNLANNHSIDQGREGLRDTWQNIRSAGMVPVGAGPTMADAASPVLLAAKPRKVWLVTSLRLALENVAYLTDRPCVSQEPFDSIVKRIHRLKARDPQAVVIVSLHWGGENTEKPVPSQRVDAHRLIDAGADALVCHHTHTLQTIENYRGRPVYYSIGNFIFDQQRPMNTQACMVKITIKEDSVFTETIPVEIHRCVPQVKMK